MPEEVEIESADANNPRSADQLLEEAYSHVDGAACGHLRGITFLKFANWFRSAGLDPTELLTRARSAFDECELLFEKKNGVRQIKNLKRRKTTDPLPSMDDQEGLDIAIDLEHLDKRVASFRFGLHATLRGAKNQRIVHGDQFAFAECKLQQVHQTSWLALASAKVLTAVNILKRNIGQQ